FSGCRYSQLVFAYGVVACCETEVSATVIAASYKPRTPRNEVMNAVYDDVKFALEDVRLDDGDQSVNRYVVAGIVSRLALADGTEQKYDYNNEEHAKEFFDLAGEAGGMVISSGRYDIVTDYRSLFTSNALKGNKDVLLYRHYDAAVGIKHAISTNANLSESLIFGPSTALIKSYICQDGKVWQNSAEADADNFEIENLMKTRDSRFEASYHINPHPRNRGSLL